MGLTNARREHLVPLPRHTGLMENLRTGNQSMLRVVHEEWDRGPGDVSEDLQARVPRPRRLARRADTAAGLLCHYEFAEAIRTGVQRG